VTINSAREPTTTDPKTATTNINHEALQKQLLAAAAVANPLFDNSNETSNITLTALQQQLALAAALQQQQQQQQPNALDQRTLLNAQMQSKQQKSAIQGWNQQTPWQQQQQLMSPLNTNTADAKAAAAVWTNALNAASNSNQQQQQKQLLQLQQQQQQQQNGHKITSSQQNTKANLTPSKTAQTANTITQALNSMYSPSQLQQKSVIITPNKQQQQQRSLLTNTATTANFQEHYEPNTASSDHHHQTQQNPEFSLNSQIIDLIKQNPAQIEQILKLKNLYQMGGGDETSILEELQSLDQTVPANLAIVAAVANLSLSNNINNNNGSSSRNSPRSSNFQPNYAQNQNSYNNNQQQQQQRYNQNQNYHQNQYNHHHHHHQQQQQQQHHNLMQLSLQQQQQLQQMQEYHEERFSRKVFVGGLPPDIDEDEIVTHFRRYGNLIVDWPHKAESKSYFPPKGYAFLIFQEERSVQDLIETCVMDDGKLYMVVSSPSMKDKPVQIRPWCLADSDFVMDGSQPLDPRKTIFVGGVPRPLKAIELAMIMDRFYGGVCYAGIDTDPELKYPKGAGRVAFSNQQSYIAAISARFVQLQHGEIDKRVEVKPYVLDDQLCDECQGARCGGKFAPFFCANVTCLQYYCEACWATIHTRPGREYHKPLVKEGADRPRPVPYK
jgi:cytoplasmic polyadenylation element-binding protein